MCCMGQGRTWWRGGEVGGVCIVVVALGHGGGVVLGIEVVCALSRGFSWDAVHCGGCACIGGHR